MENEDLVALSRALERVEAAIRECQAGDVEQDPEAMLQDAIEDLDDRLQKFRRRRISA